MVRFLRAADQVQLGADTHLDMSVLNTDYATITIPVVAEALAETLGVDPEDVTATGWTPPSRPNDAPCHAHRHTRWTSSSPKTTVEKATTTLTILAECVTTVPLVP